MNVCQDLSLLRASRAGGHSIRQTVRTSRDSLATVRSSISTWSCLCNNRNNQSQACSSIHKQNLKAFDQYFIFSKYDMIPVHAWVIHILNCLNAFVNYEFTPSIGNWPSQELCGFPHLWHALDGESCCLMPRLFSVWPLSQTCQAQTWPPAMIKNMQNLL